ncbi:Protein VAPYRIN (MtVpy) (Protein HERMES), partial [Durusdinium trenchii]
DHLAWQQKKGQLLCADCGKFYAGERGLQDHQRQKHGKAVEAALDAVELSRLALVLYRDRPGLREDGAASEASEVKGEVKGGRVFSLDPGLCAARDGDVKRLMIFLSQGWDLQTRDRHGSNALLWAAGGGHLELCRCLVEARVDLQSRQKDHRNALHWA